jgi:hypothetical protein
MYNVYTMIRKQLYMTPDQDQTVKLLSMQERKPEAEIIREVIDLGIEAKAKRKAQTAKGLLRLAELAVPGLSANLSATIDNELYEDP